MAVTEAQVSPIRVVPARVQQGVGSAAVREAVFGDQVHGPIKDAFHPVELSSEGWTTQVAVVEDPQGRDHLVVHVQEPDGRVVNTTLAGLPTGTQMQAGYAAIYIDPASDDAYSVQISRASAPQEHTGLYIDRVDPRILEALQGENIQNVDVVRQNESFSGLMIGNPAF